MGETDNNKTPHEKGQEETLDDVMRQVGRRGHEGETYRRVNLNEVVHWGTVDAFQDFRKAFVDHYGVDNLDVEPSVFAVYPEDESSNSRKVRVRLREIDQEGNVQGTIEVNAGGRFTFVLEKDRIAFSVGVREDPNKLLPLTDLPKDVSGSDSPLLSTARWAHDVFEAYQSNFPPRK